MVAAAAATGILSLYGTPAFADVRSEGSPGVSPSAVSGHKAEFAAEAAANADYGSAGEADSREGEASTSDGDGRDHGSAGEGREANSRDGETSTSDADGRDHGSAAEANSSDGEASSSDQGPRPWNGASLDGRDIGVDLGVSYGDDSGYGDDGYGDDGYEDDSGYGDDSSTPPTDSPTSPPSTPPSASPTPPRSPAPHVPHAKPPAQPPSLAETGAGEQMLGAAGVAALLVTGGTLVYRRGRVGFRR
jgi:hypothetical protein